MLESTTSNEVFNESFSEPPAPLAHGGARRYVQWNSERLDAIMAEMATAKPTGSTGFQRLDAIFDGGLYPDVYVLAAEPGAGKTTLALQIADYMATFGSRRVLFVSLEMSTPQIVAKSLVRINAERKRPHLSVHDIMRMRIESLETISQCVEDYRSQIAPRIATIDEALTIEGISELYKSLESDTKELPPVLVVDYLQIMPNDESRNTTDYQHHTANIRRLCSIAKTYSVPVLVISSKNRQKRTGASLDALMGSSDIEYGAAVVMFLSVDGNTEEEYTRNLNAYERPVTLSIRKARFGRCGDVHLLFRAGESRFVEVEP